MKTPQFELHADIEEHHWWFVARRRIMRRVLNAVVLPNPNTTVVDIGCGTGANIGALEDQYNCVGIDPSEKGIELAKERFPNASFITGLAPDDLGDLCESADVYLLMDVMEHVPDDFQFLSNLLAAIRPGARILITVPADESLWTEHDESFGHFRRYDRDRLARVWRDLPVTVQLLSYYNTRLYPIIKTIRSINQRRGHARGRAGTDFSMPSKPVNSILESIFAGESSRLCRSIANPSRAYGRGVSLIAMIQRIDAPVPKLTYPDDVPPNRVASYD